MSFVDTHTHLFAGDFDADREAVVCAAVEAGVDRLVLPSTDLSNHRRMIDMVKAYPPFCRGAVGLHPTSIEEGTDLGAELEGVDRLLREAEIPYVAVGEVGLDRYWSTERFADQVEALRFQIDLSLRWGLPLILHTREAFPEMFRVLDAYKGKGLRGVFHGFQGTADDYRRTQEYGRFWIGIGGALTFKNSPLPETVRHMDLRDIVLETDAPYLAPHPYRGKRNQSAHIPLIARKLAEATGLPPEEVEAVTTENARALFTL